MRKHLYVLMTASLVLCSSFFTVEVFDTSENHVIYSSAKAYTDDPGH